MGLFERTLGQLRSTKADNPALAMITPNGIAAFPNLRYETFVREGYMKNPMVFACIEEWATDIAEAELKVWRDGPDGPEEVEDHPAMLTFREPNPYLSGDDLLGGIEMYKRLAGNAYELKTRSRAQKTVQRWLLRPDRVTIVPSRTQYIDHYEYRIGAEKFDLDPKDVVHHKTRNPYDDYYGMPPLMPATGYTDIANFMADMIKGFLNSTGMPAGILQVSGKLSDAERALARNKFRTEFGGSNTGNIMIADGGKDAPTFTPLSMPLGARGLVVPELNEFYESAVCAVFRVPLSLAGARLAQIHSTLGQGGREADYQFFIKQQLVPEWKSVASTETMAGRGDYLADDEYFAFDLNQVQALNEDDNSKSVRILAQQSGLARSIQETRVELGLPADPKPDDLFLLPINIVPTKWSDIVNPPEPEPVIAAPQTVVADGSQPKVDNLPAPPQKRLLGAGLQVIVINDKRDVKKLLEYDEGGQLIGITESVVGD